MGPSSFRPGRGPAAAVTSALPVLELLPDQLQTADDGADLVVVAREQHGFAVAVRQRLGLGGQGAQRSYDDDVQPAETGRGGGQSEQAGQDGPVLQAVLGDGEPGGGLPADDLPLQRLGRAAAAEGGDGRDAHGAAAQDGGVGLLLGEQRGDVRGRLLEGEIAGVAADDPPLGVDDADVAHALAAQQRVDELDPELADDGGPAPPRRLGGDGDDRLLVALAGHLDGTVGGALASRVVRVWPARARICPSAPRTYNDW